MGGPGLRRSLWQRFAGILPRPLATEPFRRSVCQKHFAGISRSRLGQPRASFPAPPWSACSGRIYANRPASGSTVNALAFQALTNISSHAGAACHHTLRNHKLYDVMLGRSQTALESNLNRLEGQHMVEVVCMDLAAAYQR